MKRENKDLQNQYDKKIEDIEKEIDYNSKTYIK